MENKNNFLVKMDLSCMPTDIIPFIGKHLLTYDNKFKFNKIFKKKQDIALLNSFLVKMTNYLNLLIITLVINIKLNAKI